MRLRFIIIIFISFVFGESCNIINPSEPTPTYIHIDSFHLSITSPDSQGSASHNINAVWVYYNNNPIGIFDVPVSVPVITSGNQGLITVAPGITVDGLYNFQSAYPFYTFDTVTLKTNPGKVANYTPHVTYTRDARFLWVEDFEALTTSFSRIDTSVGVSEHMTITHDSSKVFQGKGCGYITLNSSTFDTAKTYRYDNYKIPNVVIAHSNAYVEFDYCNSAPFVVQMFGVDAGGNLYTEPPYYTFCGIYPSDANNTGPAKSKWKKLYVSVSPFAQLYTSLVNYYVVIRANLQAGQTNGYVLLDNVKLISD